MTLDAGRRKGSVVSFQKDHTDDIIADMPFSLKLKIAGKATCYSQFMVVLDHSGVDPSFLGHLTIVFCFEVALN